MNILMVHGVLLSRQLFEKLFVFDCYNSLFFFSSRYFVELCPDAAAVTCADGPAAPGVCSADHASHHCVCCSVFVSEPSASVATLQTAGLSINLLL